MIRFQIKDLLQYLHKNTKNARKRLLNVNYLINHFKKEKRPSTYKEMKILSFSTSLQKLLSSFHNKFDKVRTSNILQIFLKRETQEKISLIGEH